ncbi:Mu transposase C-terminal domain-containing protein [Tritonibacter mobilis]|uniref:Mu transposase C-terminal domain-containing protein n=1 Tax=Tritonibacter mobilis TaxID=379347 RepID=UPI0008069FA9|nr:Mu transposase C-terminal domain-containing protein [Tritonibacter mobilis]
MTSQPLYNIPRGSILQLDGRELTVSVREESGYAVECKETGECFTLSLERVETAIRNRDCEIIKPADVEKRMALLEHTDGLEFVEQLSDKDQRIVQARLALVIAQDELRAEGVKLTQRSMNKGSAELSHDQLYGTITRYFVDEYPFRPHRGTGMFGATPRQKREEALRRYGPIEAPSQRSRCLHLGEKVRATTTSEGVRAFNIPFNSKALQDLAAGTAKEVTVHLDPDDLRKVYVTAEGDEEVAETRLSMTIFKDQSLEEAIEIMENATASNPSLRVLHEENLSEAMQRRATESGFFPDSRDPLSYRKIEQLRRRADKLHQVEARPAAYIGATAAPGQLMSRGRASGVVPARPAGTAPSKPPSASTPPRASTSSPRSAGQADGAPETGATSAPDPDDIKTMTFGPIKDSKL